MMPGAQAERAGPADIDPAVLAAAQIRAMFGNAQPGFTHILLIGLTGAMAWDFAPHGAVVLWAAGIMAVGLMRLAMVRRFTAVAPPDAALPGWERAYLALVALNGVMWGSAATLLQAPGHYELEVAIAFVVGGMCAAATITLSPRYRAIPVAVVPALGILAGQFWLSDIPTSNEMALMLLVYLLVLLNVGRRMNAQVRESFALRFTNQALVASLSDALAQTRRALDEAQRSAQAKTRFLASASHDLRQPVHALRLFVETLAARPLDHESAALVARVRESLAGLRGLLDTLLDISRLDAGTVQPVSAPLALGPLLAQAADAFASLADERGLRLSLRPTEAWVLSDPTLLGRLLRNLIENALSYTSEGGVLIGTRRRGDQVLVEVWDTGIGIAPEHEQEIFQEFFSLRGRSSDRQGGLGLGLAIVKRLCGLLGHDLAFRSIPGRGSVFRVTLPACAPALALPLPDRAHAIPRVPGCWWSRTTGRWPWRPWPCSRAGASRPPMPKPPTASARPWSGWAAPPTWSSPIIVWPTTSPATMSSTKWRGARRRRWPRSSSPATPGRSACAACTARPGRCCTSRSTPTSWPRLRRPCWPRRRPDKPQAHCRLHRRGAVAGVEQAQDGGAVILHRLQGDAEAVGDFLVAGALGHQAQDRHLPLGQAVAARRRHDRGLGKAGFAVQHGLQGVQQGGDRRGLGDEAGGAVGTDGLDLGRGVVAADHQQGGAGRHRPDDLQAFGPGHARHVQVDQAQGDGGFGAQRGADGGQARRLDHPGPWVELDQHLAQPVAKQGVVVGDQNRQRPVVHARPSPLPHP
nr:HAMP domain-containing sensor histidine kinase [Oleomonas cavernae]